MTDEITNAMLLEHMQAMKYELQQQIQNIGTSVKHIEGDLKRLEEKVGQGFQKTDQRFTEAEEHRNALQKDLEETILVQGKHAQQLARLSS